MPWVKPNQYSKSRIDAAGDTLTSATSTDDEKNEALKILDYWRAVHSYPMHIFKIRLKEKAKVVDENALIAQRLKRVPAIVNKLKRRYEGREPTMKLSQMQDIGGCRAVLSSVSLVRKLYKDYYIRGDLKHKKVGEKDYIERPKKDGYRSIHLIYKFYSDKGKKEYNGLLVEIQLRSKLQHLWATAIETVDFFTRQAIKSNEGQQEWMEFFKLVSSAFAKMENCNPIPDMPTDEKELYLEINKKEAELNVIEKMRAWTKTVEVFERFQRKIKNKANIQFFLLELDVVGGKLNITAYSKKDEQKAIKAYADAEKKYHEKKQYDVVLVGTDTDFDLRKAYPNYYADTGEFLQYLQKITEKY